MNRTIAAALAALALAACGGASANGTTASNETCVAPHGLSVTGAAGDALVADADVADVRVVKDPEKPGLAALAIRLNDAAGARMESYTARHVGETMVISVHDREVARPKIRDPIGAKLLVTGDSEAAVAAMRADLCGR